VNARHRRIRLRRSNNQLAHHGIEKLLADRGILYAPDYVVNSRRSHQVATSWQASASRARLPPNQICHHGKVLAIATPRGAASVAADRLAQRRHVRMGRLRGIWLHDGISVGIRGAKRVRCTCTDAA